MAPGTGQLRTDSSREALARLRVRSAQAAPSDRSRRHGRANQTERATWCQHERSRRRTHRTSRAQDECDAGRRSATSGPTRRRIITRRNCCEPSLLRPSPRPPSALFIRWCPSPPSVRRTCSGEDQAYRLATSDIGRASLRRPDHPLPSREGQRYVRAPALKWQRALWCMSSPGVSSLCVAVGEDASVRAALRGGSPRLLRPRRLRLEPGRGRRADWLASTSEGTARCRQAGARSRRGRRPPPAMRTPYAGSLAASMRAWRSVPLPETRTTMPAGCGASLGGSGAVRRCDHSANTVTGRGRVRRRRGRALRRVRLQDRDHPSGWPGQRRRRQRSQPPSTRQAPTANRSSRASAIGPAGAPMSEKTRGLSE